MDIIYRDKNLSDESARILIVAQVASEIAEKVMSIEMAADELKFLNGNYENRSYIDKDGLFHPGGS